MSSDLWLSPDGTIRCRHHLYSDLRIQLERFPGSIDLQGISVMWTRLGSMETRILGESSGHPVNCSTCVKQSDAVD